MENPLVIAVSNILPEIVANNKVRVRITFYENGIASGELMVWIAPDDSIEGLRKTAIETARTFFEKFLVATAAVSSDSD